MKARFMRKSKMHKSQLDNALLAHQFAEATKKAARALADFKDVFEKIQSRNGVEKQK